VTLTWFSTVVDCRDPRALAGFWCQVLGYQVVYQNEREVDIAPGPTSFPGLAFLRVPGDKQVKNRLHIDLNPGNPGNPADQAAEVARLQALGATRIDIGQGDAEWIVMADPEGNEFCVLAHQAGW
jgi:catechol 2,3-dioxygenase-like lactoylglutathione lyase family enzyme